MLGFPKPYPEELLYSTVARAGVHDGETSPKQLLDQVFLNRKVIATVDLPSHVQSIAQQYPENGEPSTASLIDQHTLLPIYAPFMPAERVLKLREWMTGSSYGAVHLASGIAASRVKAKNNLYVCKQCLLEQQSIYGEGFLHRLWQVPLVKVCPIHGALSRTNIELDSEHRHTFFPIDSVERISDVLIDNQDQVFAKQSANLLNNYCEGISYSQWTLFYKRFAANQNYLNGSRIDHAQIRETVVKFWGKKWLEGVGLHPVDAETSWLKSIFRKHRKSFSFAEHIVAITALSEGQVNIAYAIQEAASLKVHLDSASTRMPQTDVIDESPISPDQLQWLALLSECSPKLARNGNKALYARLYRNHHDWLMVIDLAFHTKSSVVNNRVDWPQRDRQCARELKHIIESLADDLDAPHLSRTFLIHQLNQRATIEKNLSRLPRCEFLLTKYSESTTEYQARRLVRAYLVMKEKQKEIKRWSLIREAGLSDERMTNLVSELLTEILRD